MGPLSFAFDAERPSSLAPLLASPSLNSRVIVRPELVLVPRLCCPLCGKIHMASSYRRGDAIHECVRTKRCGQHWWSMVIEEGPVLEQLTWSFEDADIAAHAVEAWRLPVYNAAPAYWQVPLTGNQVHHHRFSPPRVLFHAIGLLRGIR